MFESLLSAFLDPILGTAAGGLMDALGLGPEKPKEKKQMAPMQEVDTTKSEAPLPFDAAPGGVIGPSARPKRQMFARGQNIDEALNKALSKYTGGV